MEVTILGSGSSIGVPAVGCKCRVCTSSNTKNHRSRASIYVRSKNTAIIVDTSPDLRMQCLKTKIEKLDGVFYTHSHADHVNGIDDVKSFNYLMQKPLPSFADKETLNYLKKTFGYVFKDVDLTRGWYKPWLQAHEIEYGAEFCFDDIPVKMFKVIHGKLPIASYRFGDVAYTTDTTFITQDGFDALKGVKLWIVDCLRYSKSEGHATFDQAISWIKKVKPEQAVLTHMAHDIEYEELSKKLPNNIKLAFDGMKILV